MGVRSSVRVNERYFLNLPGFYSGAYVIASIEDTRGRGPGRGANCGADCKECPYNFEPEITLEIADCDRRINLEFDVDSEDGRANSLHKLDTLIAALRVFRAGLVAEFAEYDRREREIAEQRE